MSNLLAGIPRDQGTGWAITSDGRRWISRRPFCGPPVAYQQYAPGTKPIYPETPGEIDADTVYPVTAYEVES